MHPEVIWSWSVNQRVVKVTRACGPRSSVACMACACMHLARSDAVYAPRTPNVASPRSVPGCPSSVRSCDGKATSGRGTTGPYMGSNTASHKGWHKGSMARYWRVDGFGLAARRRGRHPRQAPSRGDCMRRFPSNRWACRLLKVRSGTKCRSEPRAARNLWRPTCHEETARSRFMRFTARAVSMAVRADTRGVAHSRGCPGSPPQGRARSRTPCIVLRSADGVWGTASTCSTCAVPIDCSCCVGVETATTPRYPAQRGALRACAPFVKSVWATTTHRCLNGGLTESAVLPSDDQQHERVCFREFRAVPAGLLVAFRSRSGTGESSCTTS